MTQAILFGVGDRGGPRRRERLDGRSILSDDSMSFQADRYDPWVWRSICSDDFRVLRSRTPLGHRRGPRISALGAL